MTAGWLDPSELALDTSFVEAKKGGYAVGNTKAGKGMKLGVVVDRGGVPLAAGTDSAGVPKTVLGTAVVAGIPPEAGRLPLSACWEGGRFPLLSTLKHWNWGPAP